MNYQKKYPNFTKVSLISIVVAMMMCIGLSAQVMADPVQVQVVDVDDASTIVAGQDSDVDIYVRLDNVEEYNDPGLDPENPDPTIQGIQFVFTYPSDVLEIYYTEEEVQGEMKYIPDVTVLDVTDGSGNLLPWPVYAGFVDNVLGNPVKIGLAMNPVDAGWVEWNDSFYDSDDDIPWPPDPDNPWPVNPDEIFYLMASGKIVVISAHVKADAVPGNYPDSLTLGEIQQEEVPVEAIVSLAILNEAENDPIPYDKVPGTLCVGVCDVVITNVDAECADNDVTISWDTEDSEGNPLETDYNVVYYGTNCEDPEYEEDATAGTHHEATLSGLSDGTYYYKVVSDCAVDDNDGVCYEFTLPCALCPFPEPVHTPTTVFFWGTAKIAGADAEVGDCVAAFAPGVETSDGVVGRVEVTQTGQYYPPSLKVYGNDATTGEKDGADPNDPITFKIWDKSENKIYCAVALGPDDAIFAGETRNVNLDTISAPTLKVVSAGDKVVSLEWSSVADATGYNVYRSTTSGDSYDLVDSVSDTSYQDGTVVNCTTYYYVVTVLVGDCESPYSNEVSVEPPFYYLTTPTVCFFHGTVKIEGVDAAVGDKVAAFAKDDDGNDLCIGAYKLTEAGQYGPLKGYGDDGTTDEKDGADPGEIISFKIWNAGEDLIFDTINLGPCDGEWQNGETCEANLDTAPEIIPLNERWNLMSFRTNKCFYQGAPPTDVPAGVEMVDVVNDLGFADMVEWFDSIISPNNAGADPVWRRVTSFDKDGAHLLDRELTFINDLTYMCTGYGYWVKVEEGTGGAELEFRGPRIAADATLELQSRWNLIGYLPSYVIYDSATEPTVEFSTPPDPPEFAKVSVPLVDFALASLKDGANYMFRRLTSFDINGAHLYDTELTFISDLNYMGLGYGYWMKIYDDYTTADLNYPATPPTPGAPALASNIASPVASYTKGKVIPTNTSVFLYGNVTVDGRAAKVGDAVSVYDADGVLAGEFVITKEGMYGAVPVYGDDVTSKQDEGASSGDQLFFRVNGQPAEIIGSGSAVWTSDKDVLRVDLFVKTRIIPTHSRLLQNYPNPFNPETWIPYQLKESANATIRIYSVSGRLVKSLSLGRKEAGEYLSKQSAAYWDGTNDTGELVTSGVYFYELRAGDFKSVRKMVILK